MVPFIQKIRSSLVSKLILSAGFILLLTISTWSYFSIAYQKTYLQDEVVSQTERLGNTIKLGTHYAMMLNSRDDINQIITNIGRLKEIQNIRIYNKEGAIKFSNHGQEVEQITNIKSEACHICHHSEPPLVECRPHGTDAGLHRRRRPAPARRHHPDPQRGRLLRRRLPFPLAGQEGSRRPGRRGVPGENRPGNSFHGKRGSSGWRWSPSW